MNVCQETIRVLIVDDQRLIRKTLEMYLDTQANIEVLDCAACGVDALEQIDNLKPDIAIVDLEMPGMSGITTIEIITERFPETKTIVLSSHEKKEYINQAVTAGARGYLIKGATPEEITSTIEKVNLGYFQLGSKFFENSQDASNAEDVEFDPEVSASEIFESEQDIPFIPTKVEVVNPGADKAKSKKNQDSEDQNREFRKIRRELVEILEFKANLATKQKRQMQLKYQALQTKFSWLLASQVVLFLVTIGCISSLVQVQLRVVNLQENTSSLNSVQLAR